MGLSRPGVLFVYKDFSQFAKKDFEILDAKFNVKRIRSPFEKSLPSFLWTGFLQFFKLIWYTPRSNVIFCWFADYHSFLPAFFSKIFGKRFYLVLGGYDVTHVKELNYGSFNKKFRAWCTRYSMRAATMNLAVAESLGLEARERAGEINMKVLPTGYDPEIYLPSARKEDIVLTVSVTRGWQRYMVKGLDRFVALAKLMPEFQFVIIGMDQEGEKCIKNQPDNLLLIPPSNHEDLLDWYGRARYYAQFSRSEGLPNAVCEAMLRNCIPIGIKTGGIPEAIGDTGIVLEHWDAIEMAGRMRSIENLTLLAEKARERIEQHFHHSRREDELISLCR